MLSSTYVKKSRFKNFDGHIVCSSLKHLILSLSSLALTKCLYVWNQYAMCRYVFVKSYVDYDMHQWFKFLIRFEEFSLALSLRLISSIAQFCHCTHLEFFHGRVLFLRNTQGLKVKSFLATTKSCTRELVLF